MTTYGGVESARDQKQSEQNCKTVGTRPLIPAAHQKMMFEDSLLEVSSGLHKRRTWATFLSFLLECLLVGVLLLIPLWFTEALPRQQLLTFLEAPPPPPPPASPAPSAARVVKITSDIANARLRTPGRIPAKVQMMKEDDALPPLPMTSGVVGGVPGGIPGGQIGGVIGGIVSSTSSLAAVPNLPRPVSLPQRVRMSQGVSKGLLTYRVEPTYPAVAQQARIHGVVVLTAIIGKDGSIQNLEVARGHPMLAPAAIDAVKQWRYKPFLLNGQPVEVETTVTVTFELREG